MTIADEYMRFVPGFVKGMPEHEEDKWLVFYKNRILVKSVDDKVFIPAAKDIEGMNKWIKNSHYIGAFDGYNCYTAEIDCNIELEETLVYRELRSLISLLDDDMFLLCSRAAHLLTWYKNNKYCGRCGVLFEEKKNERAKVCPVCGLVNYPRISPAIIVAVIKDNKILLAYNKSFPAKFYSVLAGFVEPGETFEQCVKREVYEEVGIMVKNIRYFGSQPWPFPDSLMVGFTAEYAGGEITVDGEEISCADWFEANNLPVTPSKGSIARELIDWFKER